MSIFNSMLFLSMQKEHCMLHGTRITRQNIGYLANEAGVTVEKLHDKMVKSRLEFKKEQDKQWSYEFFGKDNQWYDDTMQKVKMIRESLDDNLSYKEKTIKMYGWIEKNGRKNLSMPMMYDKDLPEYSHAVAVEYILTNPDAYHKMMNWD